MTSIARAVRPNPGPRWRELECYVGSLTNRIRLPERKFVIFAHYRTGSTLLQSLLSSHSQILCERELFLDFMPLRYKKVLFPYLYVKRNLPRSKTAACGFVLRLDQLDRVLLPLHGTSADFLQRLASDGWKIIHLKRINHLRQALSNVTSRLRGQSHDSIHRPMSKNRVRVDPGHLVTAINWMENISRKEDELMRGFEHMPVVYEHDLVDPGMHQATGERVFDYLGLEPSPVATVYRRIASDNVFEPLANAAEIEALIRRSRYSVYL